MITVVNDVIRVYRIKGIPQIKEGDDLAEIITSLFNFEDRDVLCIASTIVSKSEGRKRSLNSYKPSKDALRISKKVKKDPRLVQAVIEESEEILIEDILLVKAKFGNICVNAGVDTSNVENEFILLPPENPDKSAERLRERIKEICGKDVAVIITDTNGRCFRRGVVGFAIGCSGLKVMRDWRGEKDIYGKKLSLTIECIADEISAFANLLMGEGKDGIPAVVFRGLMIEGDGKASEIYREEKEDVIRKLIKKINELTKTNTSINARK